MPRAVTTPLREARGHSRLLELIDGTGAPARAKVRITLRKGLVESVIEDNDVIPALVGSLGDRRARPHRRARLRRRDVELQRRRPARRDVDPQRHGGRRNDG